MSQLDLRFATADAVCNAELLPPTDHMKPDSRNAPPQACRGEGCNEGSNDGSNDRRNDTALAAIVDEAIRFDAERGAALAWAYLAQHGLPPETILRVLTPQADGHVPRRAPGRAVDGFQLRH